ncbi:hypothetical protein D3C76_1537880 [compost metagenome]
MAIDHAALAVGGDDHEAFVVGRFPGVAGEMANGRAQAGLPVTPLNEVGLFAVVAFVDPLIPAIHRADGSVWSDHSKEGAACHFLDRRTDPVLVIAHPPVRPPTPLHQACA